MAPTRRCVFVFAFGLLPTLFAAAFAPSFASPVFWVYNLFVIILFLADARLIPKDFKANRAKSEKLSHFAANRIIFFIENKAKNPFFIECKDEYDSGLFEEASKPVAQWVFPNKKTEYYYEIIPKKRGIFVFSHIHLKIKGLLGLAYRYISIATPQEYFVYPNIKDLEKNRLLVQKRRIMPRGDKAIRIYGDGREFESLRQYADGDDYRKINWAATARAAKPIINNYMDEKNQPVIVMLDAGRSMSYSVRGFTKLDYVVNAALILADIVNTQGDVCGLMTFNKKPGNFIKPGKGENHRNILMETLYGVHPTRDASDFEAAFKFLRQKQTRRSLVFIFTDFETEDEANDLLENIYLIKQKHFPIITFLKNERLDALSRNKDKHVREVVKKLKDERRALLSKFARIAYTEALPESFNTASVNKYLSLRKI